LRVVFRRDSKVDAFQRQISALRQQLGGDTDDRALPAMNQSRNPRDEFDFRTALPEIDSATAEPQTVRDIAPIDRGHREFAEPLIPSVDLLTSVVAHTTTWNGTLESSGSVHVHGRVEGSLTAQDDIFIAAEGEVDANISATNVTVAGSVRGSIKCGNRFEILPRGRVVGDVLAPVLVIHEGALMVGDIAMAPANQGKSTTATLQAARGRG
jgi:cytoskeletal protein CcmA (bactofilin family)